MKFPSLFTLLLQNVSRLLSFEINIDFINIEGKALTLYNN